MSEPDSELTKAVAAHHGLDERAARLLTGETIEELEASATALAKLVGREEQEPADPGLDLFTAARSAQERKRNDFTNALLGPPAQRRDEQGHFTSTSFDGGARQQPVRREPEDHGTWLARVLRERRADAGARF